MFHHIITLIFFLVFYCVYMLYLSILYQNVLLCVFLSWQCHKIQNNFTLGCHWTGWQKCWRVSIGKKSSRDDKVAAISRNDWSNQKHKSRRSQDSSLDKQLVHRWTQDTIITPTGQLHFWCGMLLFRNHYFLSVFSF